LNGEDDCVSLKIENASEAPLLGNDENHRESTTSFQANPLKRQFFVVLQANIQSDFL
jgi:hypothetical protein